jgi:hypothetical protein
MRHFGVTAKDASTAEAATAIGRWALLGIKGGGISQEQYDALTRFTTTREHYLLSLQVPDSLRSKGGSHGGGTVDEQQEADRAASLQRQYDGAMAAIKAAQIEHRNANLFAAVQHVIIGNSDFPHMIGDVRIVGNALSRLYQGLDRKTQIRHFPAQIVASTY